MSWFHYGYVVTMMLVDIRTRTYPWWLLGIGVGILAYHGHVSVAGIVCGGLLTLLADTPGGDFRASMVLGAMIGPSAISWTLAGAFMLTLVQWRIGLTGVPWTVYIGLLAPFFSTIYPP